MKQLLFVLTAFILLSFEVYAEKGVVKGKVIDQDQKGLPGATLRIKELNIGFTTDINGRFTCLNIDPGTYTLEVSYIGFESKQEAIVIKNGEATTLNIKLKSGVLLRSDSC